MSLADEIKLTIIERGELSKSDIQRLWGLSDERYRALQDELDGVKVLGAGSKGTGGYEAAYAKRPGQPDESLPGPTSSTSGRTKVSIGSSSSSPMWTSSSCSATSSPPCPAIRELMTPSEARAGRAPIGFVRHENDGPSRRRAAKLAEGLWTSVAPADLEALVAESKA